MPFALKRNVHDAFRQPFMVATRVDTMDEDMESGQRRRPGNQKADGGCPGDATRSQAGTLALCQVQSCVHGGKGGEVNDKVIGWKRVGARVGE